MFPCSGVDTGLSDAVSITYDALGRMVEQNRSGAYTQIVYSANGQKLALMNGTTLQRAMLPLPGQAQAVYNSSGLLYYAHPDFLGTIRLATTPGEAVYFDTAYAPFGETYASTGTLEPSYTGQVADTAHRQDTAGGLYDFPVREYEVLGRWPSPDPLGKDATCPKDPQTENRYAYVRNNPMSYTDPTGAQSCDPEDPNCDPCIFDPFSCFPPPFPGGGSGSGKSEKPRPFPWQLLPPLFFGESADDRTYRTASTTYKFKSATLGICTYQIFCGNTQHSCGVDTVRALAPCPREFLILYFLVVRQGMSSECETFGPAEYSDTPVPCS